MRRTTTILVILATCAAFTLPQVSAAAAPRCFGRKATIVGTNRSDVLRGTRGDDVIVGLRGSDTIRGRGGDDLICAGKGRDAVLGGAGSDLISGDAGSDDLRGGGGPDLFLGGKGNDAFNGGSGPDLVSFWFAPGPVTVDLGTGEATGEGTDTLVEIEDLEGSPFDDSLTGDEGQNVFIPGPGNDVVDGAGDLRDVIFYWWSRTAVVVDLSAGTAAGEGTDTLTGLEWIVGSPFGDTLTGDAGPNWIFGEEGNDALFGLEGDDFLVGGGGTDTLDGGDGTDTCSEGETTTACEG